MKMRIKCEWTLQRLPCQFVCTSMYMSLSYKQFFKKLNPTASPDPQTSKHQWEDCIQRWQSDEAPKIWHCSKGIDVDCMSDISTTKCSEITKAFISKLSPSIFRHWTATEGVKSGSMFVGLENVPNVSNRVRTRMHVEWQTTFLLNCVNSDTTLG